MSKRIVEKIIKHNDTEYCCDICGKVYDFRYTQRSCIVCGRDVCSSCSVMSDTLTEEEVYSDYPSRYCNICWNTYKEFREKLNDLVGKFETDKALLYSEWKNLSNSLKSE